MKEYTIKEFLNTDFLQYANYKVIQQLPVFQDTLSQTARKIIWAVSKNPNKNYKTTEIHPLITNETNYMHGDNSAMNVWNTLAAKYANNLNIVTAKANFGYRTSKEAAAARYAKAKYSDLAKILFPNVDRNIVSEQMQEGKIIEPHFILPILPINVINGFNGIAVGFSATILPRDPKVIYDIIYNILTGKRKNIPSNIPVKIPYYKGRIETGETDRQVIFYGVIKKDKNTKRFGTLLITELNPKWQRDTYNDFLEKAIDTGFVQSYNENCIKNDFYYEVKVPIEIYDKSEEELLDLFRLTQKSSENLTFIKYGNIKEDGDIEKTIVEYNNIAEFLKDWIIERLKFYGIRKRFILESIEKDIIIIENRINFIDGILNKTVIIEKQKKDKIIAQLEKLKFIKIDDNFNYLLNMPIYSLTEEKINELKNKLIEIKKEYQEIEKKEPKEFWVEDLKTLQTFIKSEIKEKTL